jgi:uncharacterized membrane protein YgcG
VDLLDVAAAAVNARNLVAEAGGSTDGPSSALSVADSTEDVFAEYCAAQVELVAHSLGRGARCMLYLRSALSEEGSLQLAEVASFPPSSPQQWSGSDQDEHPQAGEHDYAPAAESFANAGRHPERLIRRAGASAAGSGGFGGSRSNGGGGVSVGGVGSGQAITLSGGGSVDDSDGHGGQMTAAEAMLVKQRVFALPSTNALVVPLSRDNILVGLLVGEMPEGGGWKRHRGSARTRAKRERAKAAAAGGTSGELEVEVLSAAGGSSAGGGGGASLGASAGGGSAGGGSAVEDEAAEAEAADTAAQFGDRRQAALNAAARAIVAAWAMHRRADYATAAAVRSDRRVAGFTYAAREPLTVLRTLGGMLSSHLKPDTPSRDMADAIVAQGDALASLSEELESALYPQQVIEELTAGLAGSAGVGGRGRDKGDAPGGGGGGGDFGGGGGGGSATTAAMDASTGVGGAWGRSFQMSPRQLPAAAAASAPNGDDGAVAARAGPGPDNTLWKQSSGASTVRASTHVDPNPLSLPHTPLTLTPQTHMLNPKSQRDLPP